MFVFWFLISSLGLLDASNVKTITFRQMTVDKFFKVGGTLTSSESLLRCGSACLNEETCRSLGFHKIRKECYLYSFVLYSDFCNVTDIGFVTFINQARSIDYGITIKTGNVLNGDTDATVYIRINGSVGLSKKIYLDDKKVNDFERGMNSLYPKQDIDHGEIYNIIIAHLNNRGSPDWFLEKVTIKKRLSSEEVRLRTANCTSNGYVVNLPTYEIYHYNYNDWIATDRGDGSLVKTLVHDQKTYE